MTSASTGWQHITDSHMVWLDPDEELYKASGGRDFLEVRILADASGEPQLDLCTGWLDFTELESDDFSIAAVVRNAHDTQHALLPKSALPVLFAMIGDLWPGYCMCGEPSRPAHSQHQRKEDHTMTEAPALARGLRTKQLQDAKDCFDREWCSAVDYHDMTDDLKAEIKAIFGDSTAPTAEQFVRASQLIACTRETCGCGSGPDNREWML